MASVLKVPPSSSKMFAVLGRALKDQLSYLDQAWTIDGMVTILISRRLQHFSTSLLLFDTAILTMKLLTFSFATAAVFSSIACAYDGPLRRELVVEDNANSADYSMSYGKGGTSGKGGKTGKKISSGGKGKGEISPDNAPNGKGGSKGQGNGDTIQDDEPYDSIDYSMSYASKGKSGGKGSGKGGDESSPVLKGGKGKGKGDIVQAASHSSGGKGSGKGGDDSVSYSSKGKSGGKGGKAAPSSVSNGKGKGKVRYC